MPVYEWVSVRGLTHAQKKAKRKAGWLERSKEKKGKQRRKRFKALAEEQKAALEKVVPSLQAKFRKVRAEAGNRNPGTAGDSTGPQRDTNGRSRQRSEAVSANARRGLEETKEKGLMEAGERGRPLAVPEALEEELVKWVTDHAEAGLCRYPHEVWAHMKELCEDHRVDFNPVPELSTAPQGPAGANKS